MRALHVINSLSGSGGAEQGLVREVTRLGSEHEQLVVRLYAPADLEPALNAAGIDSVGLGLESGNSGWNWPAGIRRLSRVVRQFRPDVLHSSLASANLIAQAAGARASLPVLSTFTLSGDPRLMRLYQPGADSIPARALRKVEQRSARRPHVWFRALTSDSKRSHCAAARIDAKRVTVIPRGVPEPYGSVPTRSELGLPVDRPVVLNVGRQTAQKGHADLIRAFASIDPTREAHLVILGREGDGTPSLRSAISEFGVGDRVTVIPYTERPYDYYRNADVFAFPSRMEGLGTAVLEAMACGLPVVSYDIPPIREIGGDAVVATLVPEGDVEALTSAVAAVLDDPDAASQTADTARKRIAADYSVSAVAHRVERLLVEVAASGRTR
ncbi:MAG: glycosyltransferase [Acidimicrobiia bacterium]|jgi:glycosyltransferase involved in cell wall biosynthesis